MRMRATIDTAREARARLIRHPPDRDPVNLRTGHTTGRGGAFSHCAQLVLNATVSLLLINRKLKPTNFPLVRGVLCESTPLS